LRAFYYVKYQIAEKLEKMGNVLGGKYLAIYLATVIEVPKIETTGALVRKML